MAKNERPILDSSPDYSCRYNCGAVMKDASARLTHEAGCSKNPNAGQR